MSAAPAGERGRRAARYGIIGSVDRHRAATAAVWAGALAAGIVAALVVPAPFVFAVLALVLAVSVVVAIAVQLVGGEREGFVLRLATAATGSLLVVAAVALVAAAASAVRG